MSNNREVLEDDSYKNAKPKFYNPVMVHAQDTEKLPNHHIIFDFGDLYEESFRNTTLRMLGSHYPLPKTGQILDFDGDKFLVKMVMHGTEYGVGMKTRVFLVPKNKRGSA